VAKQVDWDVSMIRAILVLMMDVAIFIGLIAVGAAFQTTLNWPTGATAVFFLPAFLYVWYRVPDTETNLRRPLGELLALFAVILHFLSVEDSTRRVGVVVAGGIGFSW
jgi:hypothetical protein